MKIKYEFANEVIEIEVDEKWGHIVLDLDRQEYNNNQTETRRHTSLFDFSPDSKRFTDDINVLEEVSHNADCEALHKAIEMLEPRQQHLIKEHYFRGRTQADIAKEEGVSAVATHQAIQRAIKKIKIFLS